MLRVEVPVFFRVTTWAALVVPTFVAAKVSFAGVRVMVGLAAPVPERVTFCGDPVALSATLNVAVRAPAAVGLKATRISQLALAASVAAQVRRSVKSAAAAPPRVTLVMVRAVVPLLVRVTA